MPQLIPCPKCGKRINALKLLHSEAPHCPACLTPVSARLAEPGDPLQQFARRRFAEDQQMRKAARKPLHISVVRRTDGGKIVVRSSLPRLLLLLGITGAAAFQAFASFQSGRNELTLLFGIVGALLLCYSITQLANRTVFEVSKEGLRVSRGPLDWLHENRTYPRESISGIHIEDSVDPFGTNGTQRRFYHLILMTSSGESRTLLKGESPGVVSYLENALSEMMEPG